MNAPNTDSTERVIGTEGEWHPAGRCHVGESNMRVLVCGGRDYKNRDQVFEALDGLMAKHGL